MILIHYSTHLFHHYHHSRISISDDEMEWSFYELRVRAHRAEVSLFYICVYFYETLLTPSHSPWIFAYVVTFAIVFVISHQLNCMVYFLPACVKNPLPVKNKRKIRWNDHSYRLPNQFLLQPRTITEKYLTSADPKRFHSISIFASLLDWLVRIQLGQCDPVADNVPKSIVHHTANTTNVSVSLRAVYQLLLRQRYIQILIH